MNPLNDRQAPGADDDLPRDPALSAHYRAVADGEPPAALDAAILAAAHAALAAPARRPGPWWQRLRVPVALAATALLTVMLTQTMQHPPPELVEQASRVAPPSSPPAPAAPPAADAPASRSAPAAKPAAAPGQTPESTPTAAAPRRAKKAPEPQLPSAPVVAPLRDEAATGSAAPALPAPAAVSQEAARSSPATNAGRLDARQRPQESAAKASAAAVPADAAAEAARLPAAEWLEEIRRLRRAGETGAAARRLAEFRLAYPDIPIPDDLRH